MDFSRVLYALIEKMGTLGQKWGPRGILSLKWDQCVGVNICPKKIWNCLSCNLGCFKTVCPGQSEYLQNCLCVCELMYYLAIMIIVGPLSVRPRRGFFTSCSCCDEWSNESNTVQLFTSNASQTHKSIVPCLEHVWCTVAKSVFASGNRFFEAEFS